MAKNVINKRAMAAFNIDSYGRSAIYTADVDNGDVFLLNERSTVDGEDEVWSVSLPTATSKGLWMATSPEVVTIKDEMGNEYKGLTKDPRAFTNLAGKVFDATYLNVNDIVEMTGAGITGISNTANIYLVPSTGLKLVTATQAPTNGASYLKKVDTSVLHIGTGAIGSAVIPTYIFTVENN